MTVQHGGCAVCGSKDEPVLVSGAILGQYASSQAVCSKPACRATVEIQAR